MNILGRDIFQVYAVNLSADLHIQSHSWSGNNEINRHMRTAVEKILELRRTAKLTARSVSTPPRVDIAELLVHLEQSCSARNAVRLERRRHCKTYGFFGAAFIGNHQICAERIQTARRALHRSVKRF